MTRRLHAVPLLLGALVLACGPSAQSGSGQPENTSFDAPWPQPIHVVVFLIDTLRADRLSLYGYERATSPHLEELAAESVVYEHASAAAPWTLPSVASLMLSQYTGQHRVLRDGDRVADDAVTLAERMRELGYRTRSVYRNPYAGPMSGLDRGFERATLAERVVGAADVEACLAEEDERPLFLYLHNVIPHDPYRPAPEFLARFGDVSEEEIDEIAALQDAYRKLTRHNRPGRRPPGRGDTSEEQGARMAELATHADAIDLLYDAEVAEADAEVGRTVAALKAAGVWDQTLFVVLSDHGEELGEHGGWEHDQSLYEELVHVPLVVHFPGGFHAGEHVAEPVSLLEVAPTILEAAGMPLEQSFGMGYSLLLQLTGIFNPADGPFLMSWRINRKKYYRPFDELRGDENLALRDEHWKGIWNVERGTLELYDLVADPGETRDLSAEEPERARRFLERAAWARDFHRTGERADASPTDAALDASDRAALRALGYVDEGEH